MQTVIILTILEKFACVFHFFADDNALGRALGSNPRAPPFTPLLAPLSPSRSPRQVADLSSPCYAGAVRNGIALPAASMAPTALSAYTHRRVPPALSQSPKGKTENTQCQYGGATPHHLPDAGRQLYQVFGQRPSLALYLAAQRAAVGTHVTHPVTLSRFGLSLTISAPFPANNMQMWI